MHAITTLVILSLVSLPILARDIRTKTSADVSQSNTRLSDGCYDGSIDAKKCCKGISDWYVHLPDPKNCGKFFHCDNGKAVHKDCPKGLHWSVADDKCEWPSIAGCDGSSGSGEDSNETSESSGSHSGEDPGRDPETLPEGCFDGSVDAKKCCKGITAWWVHLPDPKNCGKFFHCDNGKAVHKDCPKGLHWSVTADKCDWPDLAGCDDSSSGSSSSEGSHHSSHETTESNSSENPEQLPEGCYDGSISAKECCKGVYDWWVHLPDPKDCKKFYQCDNGKVVHKDCPKGLHWSVAEDKCDWPDKAGCDSSITTTSSTTTPKPTTTVTTTTTTLKPTTTITTTTTPKPSTTTTPKPTTTTTPEPTTSTTPKPSTTTTTTTTPKPTTTTTTTPKPTTTTAPETTTTTSGSTLPEGCYDGSIDAVACCEGVSDWWVHLPDPEDCGKFYQCDNGEAVSKDCPAGLHWSVVADRCEWPEIAGCEGTSNNSSTDNPGNGPTETTTEDSNSGSTGSPGPLPEGCYSGNIDAVTCCEGVSDWWVHLPNPEDCGKFFQCDNGKAVLKDCPAGLHWSVVADRCEWPEIAGCEGTSNNSSTDNPGNGPTETTTEDSNPGLPGTPGTIPEGCYSGSIDAVTCCEGVSDWWVHLPDPEDCSKFYQCDNGKAVLKDCPAGLHWSVVADRCEWPEIAGCEGISNNSSTDNPGNGPTETTTEDSNPGLPGTPGTIPEGCYSGSIDAVTCCEGVSDWWVHLPDPEDCGKFYQCDNGKAVHKDCPTGLHWSVVADRCEWPEIAGCEASATTTSKKPDTTTTTSTTTTTTTTEIPVTTTPEPISTTTTTSDPITITTEQIENTSTTTSSPVTEPEPNPEDNECTPEPICHQCYAGIFSADLCCKDVKNWQKINLAHPEDCTAYYVCVDEKAVLQRCPTGLYWSVKSDRCEWPRDSECSVNGDATTPSSTTPGDDGGNDGPSTPGEENGVSYDCIYGTADAKTCCSNVPYWKDVLLQNNEDCHTFIQCVHGEPVVRPCPAGLWWSAFANRCEWRERATCTWDNSIAA